MHLFITLLTQCYYYELLSPSFFSFLSFQISATTLTNASPITTIVSLFIVFPPFSLGFHSGNCHKEVSIGFVFTILIVIRIRCFVNAFFYFFQKNSIHDICMESHVIALPGCYLISTRDLDNKSTAILSLCQCPLGLLPHFYLYKALSKDGSSIESVNALSGCYLISTFTRLFLRTDPQSKVSMPSRAVTSFLQHCRKLALLFRRHVSMPSRAVTSFLQNR